ncbi:MAG TPA: HNH endonuclease [Candidatus Acidoferrales bacterium]|nr:HNH endonuclease [Candidatus Acidoferrales bacterium]
MKFYVAITDWEWFKHLKGIAPDELNFWQPTATSAFRVLSPGEPLLFKLHSPRNFVVGGGFFSHYTVLPVSYAWATFGIKNGAQTEEEMRSRLERYRKIPPNLEEDYQIGCILLQSPFFFEQDEWIPASDWRREIVRGKSYSTDEEAGFRLWSEVEIRLHGKSAKESEVVSISGPRFGEPQTVFPRLGQGAFRVIVTDSYKRRCAVTGSHILHVLEAAHIRPYGKGGSHDPSNGLLLRQDVHTLFDRGYLTITRDYRLEVSGRIKSEFDNGKEYYSLRGNMISVPDSPALQPSADQIAWHNERVFRS